VKDELPPMIRKPSTCSRCFQLSNCVVWHRAVEHGTAETSGLGDLWVQNTSHMTDVHGEFTAKFLALISLEASEVHRSRKEIWFTDPEARRASGRCLLDLMIDDIAESPGSKYVYRFVYVQKW
jgi:DNA replication ATP-dependent helicase Dna2